MTFQSHQLEHLPTKPVCPYTEEELLEGDRINNLRKQEDPFRQAEADRWIGREPQS